MKKFNLFLLMALFGCTKALATYTISSGSTVTLTDVSMAQDIVVEGTLIIEGTLTMGHPISTQEYYILIKDGGTVTSTGGTIEGLTAAGIQRTWYGIIIEATTTDLPVVSNALFLDNCTIRNANHAIEMAEYSTSALGRATLINRGITVKNTTFDKISNYYFAGGTDILFGTQFDNSNVENGINFIYFENCIFLTVGSIWPFHVNRFKNVTLKGCLFDDPSISTEVAVHCHNVENFTIDGCTFLRTGTLGVVFHGLNDEIIVKKSKFKITSSTHGGSYPSHYAGIAVGHQIFGGSMADFSFENNYFESSIPSNNYYGIVSGTNGSGTVGYLHRGNIEGNYLQGFGNAIAIFNNSAYPSGSPLYFTGSHRINVDANLITEYKIALELGSHNEQTYATCNLFNDGNIGIKLSSQTGPTASVPHFNYEDPHNQFIACVTDFKNTTTTLFQYRTNAGNAWPLTSFSGPLLPSSSLVLHFCD